MGPRGGSKNSITCIAKTGEYIALFIELTISGLSLSQSLMSRVGSIPANLLAARPYGIYRDFLFARTRANIRGPWVKGIVDILAFTTFQVPLYATILTCVGADLDQIMRACGTLTVLSTFMGRPYGVFLVFVRRLVDLPSHPPKVSRIP